MVGASGGVSRRALLGAGVAVAGAGSAILLGGCERSDPAPKGFGQNETDFNVDSYVLLSAVDVENMVIAAYGAAMPLLRGADLALGQRLLAQEEEHLAAVSRPLIRVGAKPNPPAAHYSFPHLTSSAQALAFASRIEKEAIAFYQDALPKFAHPAVRAMATAVMTSEAEHLATLAGARGLPPAPSAFVRGA